LTETKRAGEWIKTALIVLLTVSALLLGWRTKLFNEFFSTIPFFGSFAELVKGTTGTVESGGVTLKEAARPVCIVITNEKGYHYGVRYDTDTRNVVYNRISSIMGEALSSASAPAEISEEEWRTALTSLGVYFEYMTPVRLSVLNGWLGSVIPDPVADISVRRVVVVIGEDRSRVYYQDDENGLFYGADTASTAGKAQELEMYTPNYTVYAFETDIINAEDAPYLVLMPERYHPDLRAVAAGNADELLDVVQDAIKHGNETYTTVTEENNALRRVGTQFRISVDLYGRVTYRNTENLSQAGERLDLTESEIIELARLFVSDTIGSMCGNAEVFFSTIEYYNGRTAYIYFTYHIAGGFIHLFDDGYAAIVTVTSGVITAAELNFRNFSLTDDFTGLLPVMQAFAAAGGEFVLCYSDTGAERLSPFWARMQSRVDL